MTEPTPARKGLFIAIEGPNGSGKSTLCQELAAWFNTKAPDIALVVRNPGSSELGAHLRPFLKDVKRRPLAMQADIAVNLGSTWETYDKVIAPALEKDKIVVCDRYVLSAWVHQCLLPGRNAEDFLELASPLLPPEPDIYIRLAASEAVVRERRGQKDEPDFYEKQEHVLTECEAYAVSGSFTRAPVIVLETDETTPAAFLAGRLLEDARMKKAVSGHQNRAWNELARGMSW